MKHFLSNTTTVLIFLACIVVPVFGQRASNCSTDPDLVGYSTIQDINLDMQDIVANNTGGVNVFRLCPKTVFNVSEPLMPILSNTTFACGSNNSVQDECVFDGGSVQVMIEDILTFVAFEGLTFRNFNETSISAFAPKDSVVEFANCIWTNFSSTFAISISFENGNETAMNATLRDCVILNGQVVSLISNDGGFLEVINMTISNVRAVGLVVTGNEAITSVDTLLVTKCDVDFVTFGTGNSSVAVRDADIFENTNLGLVFYGEAGTKMTVDSSKIRDNLVERTDGQDGWSAVYANDTSTADVSGLEISGNRNMQYGVASAEFSTAFVTSSIISNNTGLVEGTSAPIFAKNDSFISVNKTILLDNVNFLFLIFAVFQSSVTVETTCIIGGSSLTAVMFVGQESNFSVVGNYIEGHPTDGCPESGPRLFQEIEGAGCFNGNGNLCDGTCLEMSDATVCLAEANSTLAPTSSPLSTPAPSSSPGVGSTNPPVTTSPATPEPTRVAPDPTAAPSSPVVSSSPSSLFAPFAPSAPSVTLLPLAPSTMVPTSAPAPSSGPTPQSSPVVGPTNPPVTTSPATPEPTRVAPVPTAAPSSPVLSSSPSSLFAPFAPIAPSVTVSTSAPSTMVLTSAPASLSGPDSPLGLAPSVSKPTSKPVPKPVFWLLLRKGNGKSKATKSTKGEKSKKGKSTKKHSKEKGHEDFYVHYPKSSKSKSTKKQSKSKGHYGYEQYEPPNQTWYGRPSGYESQHMHTYKHNNEATSTVQIKQRAIVKPRVHTRPTIIEQRPTRNQGTSRLRPPI